MIFFLSTIFRAIILLEVSAVNLDNYIEIHNTRSDWIIILAGIGRDLEQYENDRTDGRIYTVGNSFHMVNLTEEEYIFWKFSQDKSDVITWINEYTKQFNSSPERFQELYRFMEDNKLILDFSRFLGLNDNNILRYQVSKNGVVVTRDSETNEWKWQNYHPRIEDGKELVCLLSDELYEIWRCASGTTSIYDVIANYQIIQQCSIEKATDAFVNNIQKLYSLGLWSIDYIPDGLKEQIHDTEYESTKKESFFHWSYVKSDTPLMAIGEELGVVQGSGIYIHLGKEICNLSYEEYLIWVAVRFGSRNAEDIVELEGKSLDDVMVLLKSLMEKHIIMIWPDEWNFSEDTFISFHPTGFVGDDQDQNLGKYLLQESKLGSYIALDSLSFAVWLSANALFPIAMVRDYLVDMLLTDQTTAARIVSDRVPELIKHGLGSVQFTPFLAFGPKPDLWNEIY